VLHVKLEKKEKFCWQYLELEKFEFEMFYFHKKWIFDSDLKIRYFYKQI
jgi:hypothetical protein